MNFTIESPVFVGVRQSTSNPNGLSNENLGKLVDFLNRTTTANGDLEAYQSTTDAGFVYVEGVTEAQYNSGTNKIELSLEKYGNASFSAENMVNVVAHEASHAVAPAAAGEDFATRGASGLNDEATSLGKGFLAKWEINRTEGPALGDPPGHSYPALHEAQASAVRLLGPDATLAQVLEVATSVALRFAAGHDYFQYHGVAVGIAPQSIEPESVFAIDVDGDGRVDWVAYLVDGTSSVAGFSYTYDGNGTRR